MRMLMVCLNDYLFFCLWLGNSPPCGFVGLGKQPHRTNALVRRRVAVPRGQFALPGCLFGGCAQHVTHPSLRAPCLLVRVHRLGTHNVPATVPVPRKCDRESVISVVLAFLFALCACLRWLLSP
mmetsp:Transcript_24968/g.75932  ORF Transcript_24968/g.75932 Transcript_24968/m.75932 type:complete len:124 (+) Transcript_24968:211-582(+)